MRSIRSRHARCDEVEDAEVCRIDYSGLDEDEDARAALPRAGAGAPAGPPAADPSPADEAGAARAPRPEASRREAKLRREAAKRQAAGARGRAREGRRRRAALSELDAEAPRKGKKKAKKPKARPGEQRRDDERQRRRGRRRASGSAAPPPPPPRPAVVDDDDLLRRRPPPVQPEPTPPCYAPKQPEPPCYAPKQPEPTPPAPPPPDRGLDDAGVAALLDRLDLSRFRGTFADHEIDDASLALLTAEDLCSMGIPTGPLEPPPRGAATAARARRRRDERADASSPPISWHCPIGLELMRDPVFTACGNTFERACIAEWLQHNDTSPVTGEPLPHKHLVTNQVMRSDIAEWLQRNA
ncbi:ubiquitin-protein transferase [Aureococcus anophagefferens]|uniref:Ubiquitin-protein transferase n=1 Tax=Aureococcus anophagefferens TaxID=44056 RepID=A0ABR1FV69_AURAN